MKWSTLLKGPEVVITEMPPLLPERAMTMQLTSRRLLRPVVQERGLARDLARGVHKI